MSVDRCKAFESDLAVLDSKDEVEILQRELSQRSAQGLPPKMAWWIGLVDKGQGIKLMNGSSLNNTFMLINSTSPSGQSCGSMINNTISMTNCTSWLGFICERAKSMPLKCKVEEHWVYINGSCFKFFSSPLYWTAAQYVCNASESSLAKVLSQEEMSFIWDKAKIASSASWIGFQFNTVNKRYEWLDGTVVNMTIPWWNENQPGLASQPGKTMCGLIDGSSKRQTSWETQDCSASYPFTCEKPEGVCPDGWYPYQEICIKVYSRQKLSWTQSKFYCSAMGADLLKITRQSIQNVTNLYLQELKTESITSIWMGVTDDGSGQQLTWSDGSGLLYTNWALKPDAPVAGTKRFGYISTDDPDGKWQLQDSRTVTRRAFACSILKDKPFKDIVPQMNTYVCDEGWEVAGDSCVYISDDDQSFLQAQQTCLNLNAQLVVINSPDIYGYLSNRIQSGQYWIGLDDRQFEGKFQWTNNTKLSLTYWADGQPENKTDENCVILKSASGSVKWYDVKCQAINSYICQKSPVPYSANCGSMWEERPRTDFCYQFRVTKLTWQDALDMCTYYNGSLASISSKEEHSYIEGKIAPSLSVYWIGASDRLKEAGWQWTDGGPFSYLNWDRALNTAVSTTAMTTPRSIPSGKYFGCPPGWLDYNFNCYLIKTDSVNWSKADAACKQENSQLASVHSVQENDFIWSQLPKESCENLHSNTTECDTWVLKNECQKNPQWMTVNCKKSCSFCNNVCHDKYTQYQCQYWARIGECAKNPAWMWSNCAQSCGCNQDINDGYWLGFNDLQTPMSFAWTDYSNVDFTNWQVNEPNNYNGKNEDCIQMHTLNGQWTDDVCDVPRSGLVCKKPMAVLDAPTVAPNRIGCPAQGFGYGATCYVINDTPKTWAEAQQSCAQINGNLATITDRITGAFITSELVNKVSSYWIGLSNLNGNYTWVSGSSLLYTSWAPSHTGNEQNMCVAIRSQSPVGLWENLQCQQPQPFLCETQRQGFTTPVPTTPPSPPTFVLCPSPWKSRDGYCYQFFNDPKTWTDAQAHCETFGGSLLILHNDATQQYLLSYSFLNGHAYSFYSMWIGLSDNVKESSFVWIDGSPFDYSKWSQGEPNGASELEDCVELLRSSQTWNDIDCHTTRPYICAIVQGVPLPPTTTPPPTTLAPGCNDPAWTFHNGFCYYFSPRYGTDSHKTWYAARNKCLASGGDLVSILSQDENNFLTSWLSKNVITRAWIGFNQLEQEAYVWSDGKPTTYVAWGNNEPNDGYGAERCVDMSGDFGYWIDDNCMTEFGYICKKLNNSNSAIIPSPTPFIDGICPDGFLSEGRSNKCFYVGGLSNDSSNDPKLGWIEARDICRNLTSPKRVDIGSINSLQDQEYVTLLLSSVNSDMWIGFSDRAKQNSFSWQDNSEVTYANWASGEPQFHSSSVWRPGIGGFMIYNQENCVEMLRNPKKPEDTAKWNDAVCTKKNAYLCQTMKAPATTTVPNSSSSPTPTTCPKDFTQYKTNCYSFVNHPQTWEDARKLCQAQGADLASTQDAFEIARVDLGLYNNDIIDQAWIGMKYNMETQQYYWTDQWPVLRTFWSKGNPDLQTNDSCVAFSNAGWNDTSCSERLPYVCEIRKDSPPPTTPGPKGHCVNANAKRYGDFCYLIKLNEQMSWPEASYTCGRQGMQLASIHSEGELQFLRDQIDALEAEASSISYVMRTNFWIGLIRDSAGGYSWSDNTPTVYFNWANGEPTYRLNSQYSNTVTEEECVEMYRDSGQWNDLSCIGNKQGYICKTTPVFPTTVTTTTAPPTVTYSDSFPLDTTTLTGHSDIPTATNFITRPAIYHLPSTEKYKDDGGLTGGQIAGIVIGIVGAAIMVGAIVFIVKRRYPIELPGRKQDSKGYGYDNALYIRAEDDVEDGQTDQKVVSPFTTHSETSDEKVVVNWHISYYICKLITCIILK
ncbi:hypothetical protein Btru_035117 [Bulinus truncatus]|nr:hypothetical protein Btru_035117 [Bulinus truncatus]